jgi:hypothetical protein
MRRSTLVTGVVLLVIGAAVVGYHLWDMEKTESAVIHDYADVHFDSYFGSMTVYVTWSNATAPANGSSTDGYTFYVGVGSHSCSNLSGVVASGSGPNGSLTAQFNGPHDWYAYLCDPSGSRVGFLFTFHQFAPTYYLIAGTSLGVLGAALVVLARFQPPAPPLRPLPRGAAEPPEPPPEP